MNQAVGRCIRHRGDHGALLFADVRYGRPAVQAALPRWVRRRLDATGTLGHEAALASLAAFFDAHRRPGGGGDAEPAVAAAAAAAEMVGATTASTTAAAPSGG